MVHSHTVASVAVVGVAGFGWLCYQAWRSKCHELAALAATSEALAGELSRLREEFDRFEAEQRDRLANSKKEIRRELHKQLLVDLGPDASSEGRVGVTFADSSETSRDPTPTRRRASGPQRLSHGRLGRASSVLDLHPQHWATTLIQVGSSRS